MKYFDRNSDRSRVDNDVEPLVQGLLENVQIFDESTEDPAHVTSALKYTRKPQKRRKPSKYEGSDPFVNEIRDIFGFDPLVFQQTSWELVRDLEKRRSNGDSQGAIFSAPTGFGKTEAFLGPLYQLLRQKDLDRVALVYPSKALLQDQLSRMLKHLHKIREKGNPLSIGIWSGDTAYKPEDVPMEGALFEGTGSNKRFKLANCWCGSPDDPHSFRYEGGSSHYDLICEHDSNHKFSDEEVILNREDIRQSRGPEIILTTLESLELFGLKPNYDIIDKIDAIVFDEIHLYTGIRGAHAANLVDNIETITDHSLLWLGASATVDDAGRFAAKIFPVPDSRIESVAPPDEDYATDHDDTEHYFFLKATEEGPGVSSMYIQQILLLGHAMLQKEGESRGKLLSFIDSISQVNQKRTQLEDADSQRKLWRHHIDIEGSGDWRNIAAGMNRELIEEPLEFSSVFSDAGFNASVVRSDVLLSTNFLEVGIDVGEISIVTQYRTPWNLSSFVQRVGRAAREPGTDSFIFVFLSDLTSDANMFYRADRFLGSEIRTPLKPDNNVIEWIHDRYQEFYDVSSRVRERRYFSTERDREEFHEEYLVDELQWEAYHELLKDPEEVLQRELGLEGSFAPLTGEKPVNQLLQALKSRDNEIKKELNQYGLEGEAAGQSSDTVREMVEGVRRDVLSYIRERVEPIEHCRNAHPTLVDVELIENIENELSNIREAIAEPTTNPTDSVREFQNILPRLFGLKANVLRLQNAAYAEDVDIPRLRYEVNDIEYAIERAQTVLNSDYVENLSEDRKRIYYLKQALQEIEQYHGIESNFLSVYFIKHLLRGAYYFDRFLQVVDDSLADEIWYVPENYFDDAGQYLTVFHGDDDEKGTDQSIDSVVHSYTPFRSEYQQDAGKLQAFIPETTVKNGQVQFVFEDIPGERRENLIVPDSVRLTNITDLSGSKALNIVKYCPKCLQILDQGNCLHHNASAYGKIHSSPEVETNVRTSGEAQSRGILTLSDVSGVVKLTGVSLEITPATYAGSVEDYIFSGRDRIERRVETPEPTLGFEVDTRGLTFDISGYLERIDNPETKEKVDRYKDRSMVGIREMAAHTAAHFFTQLVADVAGVTPGSLFYGIDADSGEVYVFERAQGGQGLVDLVFDDIREDPGTALESITRIAYDPQVICERLWADKEFVENLFTATPNRDEIETTVRENSEVPVFDHVVDHVVEEVRSTIDRANQLANEEALPIDHAYEVKHTVASECVAGASSYPKDVVEKVLPDFKNHDKIETLFLPPDIDGCVENLHLAECISGHDQSEMLSYVLLEELREMLIKRVSREDLQTEIFDQKAFPGGEYNGTSVFLTF